MTISFEPGTDFPPTGDIPTASSPITTPLHAKTALIHSSFLSSLTNDNIYLKLDCDQPSGSFKIRGIGKICQSAVAQYGTSNTRLVTSSGGNAGLAVAYAASRAGVQSTIFVPSSTEPDVVEKLRGMGAEVVVGGDSWDQADNGARGLAEKLKGKGGVYVHPFIGNELVEGHSGLVDEIYDQFAEQGLEGEVDAIICSTGGGGLLRGIIKGVNRQKGIKPTLVAVQNFGVNSFNLSLDASPSEPGAELPKDVVTLERIASKCTSMGTKKCSLATVHDAIHYNSNAGAGGVTTLTVADELSASACWQFSESQDANGRMVELSCASALTPVFHPWILKQLVERSKGLKGKKERKLNIVVEVCGGSKVNKGLLEGYKRDAGKMEKGDRIRVNGVDIAPSSANSASS
ncbi:related to CHA1-L-serine/L-threonine deaminase [Ustilago bromivora]|uniref:L-serine ammonia-lyase n=1 Tax=Ustilago bromivora TaxID=307758 RepID=A0A1K0HA85_9BASI|nr:related to CHA1-L-serine/L-threonine deaminase [Ustilago bromivora]SYW79097.1 related to CHA1 - L-serine/L-threonine deaminase [Ustilago bromivora]